MSANLAALLFAADFHVYPVTTLAPVRRTRGLRTTIIAVVGLPPVPAEFLSSDTDDGYRTIGRDVVFGD